jgi:hypothetical protein
MLALLLVLPPPRQVSRQFRDDVLGPGSHGMWQSKGLIVPVCYDESDSDPEEDDEDPQSWRYRQRRRKESLLLWTTKHLPNIRPGWICTCLTAVIAPVDAPFHNRRSSDICTLNSRLSLPPTHPQPLTRTASPLFFPSSILLSPCTRAFTLMTFYTYTTNTRNGPFSRASRTPATSPRACRVRAAVSLHCPIVLSSCFPYQHHDLHLCIPC